MKNKLETVIGLIDQIIIIAFIITLVVIIKNIISDKATSAESVSKQAVQVQQESVSTSETAESTSETSESVDESSSEIEDADSTESEADQIESETTEPADEASKITDETVESTDTNSEVQVDEPGTVSIDLDSDPDIIDGFDDMEEGVPASDEAVSWALDLAEKNGTVLH